MAFPQAAAGLAMPRSCIGALCPAQKGCLRPTEGREHVATILIASLQD